MMRAGRNRCVCGASSRFPLCDGDHGGADWSCAADTEVGVAVVAIGHLRSLGERLAHRLGGMAVHKPGRAVQADRMIVVSDGTDLAGLLRLLPSIEAAVADAICLDGAGPVVSEALGMPVHELPEHEPLQLWPELLRALDRPPVERSVPRLFVSHAIQDEARLEPCLSYLRATVGADVFTCADSIPAGEDWRASIIAALERAERFVFIGSEASCASSYCAFEAGYALASGLPVRLVLLEPGAAPAYLGNLHGADVERIAARRPWLSPDEALLDALLLAVA